MIRQVISFLLIFPITAFASCDVEKFHTTPISNMKKCDEFLIYDTELNKRYKLLVKKLNQKNKETLKVIQKQWIDWRDEKCDEEQENSGCNNGLCNGVAHDMCIIDLTIKRTEELKKFKLNIDSAIKENFQYSKIYNVQ